MTDWAGFIALSWLAADFIAGVFHWLEDRYFKAEWPIIGNYIAGPNQLHHAQPQAFLKGSYFTRNWTTFVPSLTGLFVCLCVPTLHFGWLTCLFLTQANQIHCWAHQAGKMPRIVGILQETGLLQTPKHHAEHHRSPHLVRYCVMSNWLNPILDATRFWNLLEAGLQLIRIKPRS